MIVTIYHNPKCSKSRQTLSLLKENGVEPEIVLYLDTPPSADQLKQVLSRLGMKAHELLRPKEAREAGLAKDMPEDELIDGMIANPRCIERPIVVKGETAVLGRPPENALSLL